MMPVERSAAGLVELATHPWVVTARETILGPEYEIVEVGFDIPFRGAKDSLWHRDLAAPRQTYEGRRLTSLAFNLTPVDTILEMGPFEIAPGTQWEAGLARIRARRCEITRGGFSTARQGRRGCDRALRGRGAARRRRWAGGSSRLRLLTVTPRVDERAVAVAAFAGPWSSSR